jgi:hypothetical protein
MSFAGKWMGLEIITLSKIRQTEKNTTYFLSYVESKSKKNGNKHECTDTSLVN